MAEINTQKSDAYNARRNSAIDVIIYAPIVSNDEYNTSDDDSILSRYLEYTRSTRSWLDESRRIFDTLQPGYNRSIEPIILSLPSVMYDIDPLTKNFVARSSISNSSNAPVLHVSPPPAVRGNEYVPYQNINMLSLPEMKNVADASVTLQGKLNFLSKDQ
jgi:hypothetical protein